MKLLTLLLLFTSLALPLRTEEAKKPELAKVWMDPAKVDDEDFLIQGEYSGETGGKKTAVQVWAQGGGSFEAVIYQGGLPGDGWDGDRGTVVRVKGGYPPDGKMVIFEQNGVKSIADGHSFILLNVQRESGVKLNSISLKRISRQSPTMGAKPPQGAMVLFDGKETSHFPDGKMTPDGLLEQGATSSDKFGDGTLHIEFMLSYKPYARGQQRGNSGVYLQGRYEVQVLDSFALEGKNNDCGAIYSIAAPKQNLAFPPLSWQTYDIDFTAAKYDVEGKKTSSARMTIKHNGVLIHDNVDVPHITTSAPVQEENMPGPLHLQNHGNPARYRNIWFLPK